MADKRPVIIDTDTGSDDAVALIMALREPSVHVLGLTIVSGNVPLEQASINARYTLELCGKNLPVFDGCYQPLERERSHATWFHGEDGMGNQHYPAPTQSAQTQHAVDYLIEQSKTNCNKLELITLGPLTNIAKAIQQDSSFVSRVKHCYIMGGAACCVGNVTPAAEYNIWCDPEAAKIVFESGLAITMIGWENSCGDAALSEKDINQILELNNPIAKFAIECNQVALDVGQSVQHGNGLLLADPVAMAVALDPNVCIYSSRHPVVISCAEETRGMTIVDKLNICPNESYNDQFWSKPKSVANICWAIDIKAWKKMLLAALA